MNQVPESPRFEVNITGTHSVRIPDEYAVPFEKAGHKRIKIKAYFHDNEITLYGAIHRYQGYFVISFGKRYQKELGVSLNDHFELQLSEDDTEYGVAVPEEFSAVLESDPEAMEIFNSFTDGKKRSLVFYVLKFRNSQTRIDKSLIIAENIKLGITDPRELIKDRR